MGDNLRFKLDPLTYLKTHFYFKILLGCKFDFANQDYPGISVKSLNISPIQLFSYSYKLLFQRPIQIYINAVLKGPLGKFILSFRFSDNRLVQVLQ